MTAKDYLESKGIFSLVTKKRTEEVYQWMEEYANQKALHIAEQAVEKELSIYATNLRVLYFNQILSRIKTLTQTNKED